MSATTNLIVRVPPETKARIEAAASRAGLTPAEWVRRTLYRRLGIPAEEARTRYGAPDPLANLRGGDG